MGWLGQTYTRCNLVTAHLEVHVYLLQFPSSCNEYNMNHMHAVSILVWLSPRPHRIVIRTHDGPKATPPCLEMEHHSTYIPCLQLMFRVMFLVMKIGNQSYIFLTDHQTHRRKDLTNHNDTIVHVTCSILFVPNSKTNRWS